MKTCGICSHPDRAAIDAAMVAGESLRDIVAGHNGTTRSALDRHRKHIAPALTQAKQAEEVADATTLLSRVEKLMSRCESLLEGATKDKKWAGAAAAARELRGCLELIGKLTGELHSKTLNSNTVNILNEFGNVSLEALLLTATDEQLEELLKRGAPSVTLPEYLAYGMPVFDEETIPPFDIDGHRRHEAILRETEKKMGWEETHGWSSGVTSDAEGRKRMLVAAWKRETGRELPAKLNLAEFQGIVKIEMTFDLERGSQWPQVHLKGYRKENCMDSHAPKAKTIQGAR